MLEEIVKIVLMMFKIYDNYICIIIQIYLKAFQLCSAFKKQNIDDLFHFTNQQLQNLILIYQLSKSMLKNQLNKSIRSLPNSKEKNTQLMKNHPKIFQVYKGDKRHNYKFPSNKKIVGCGKINISKTSRNNSSTYQFPQFSINFEEGAHWGAVMKGKKSLKSEKKELESFIMYQKDTQDFRKDKKPNEKTVSKQNLKKDKKPLIKKDQFYHNYQDAIRKIFKALDIFNRGQISEINVNKWVPQSALYFLGKVFQRIKQFKLTLTEAQFQNLSKPLFQQSSEQDIKWFINQVNIKDNMLKVSINMNDPIKKEELSPIKMRMINEEMQASRERSVNNTKNSHLNQIMNLINDGQKEALQKLRIVKQRQKTTPLNVLGEINNNQYMIKYRNQVEALKTKGNYANKQTSQLFHNEQKLCISHLKNSIQRFSPSCSIKKKDYQKQNNEVPNFNLVAQKINSSNNVLALAKTINTDQQFFQQKKDSIVVQKYSNFLEEKSIVNVNVNSRFRKESPGEVKRAIVSEENQRLDKLSNKLQEYIKLNRAKIQNSMDFIRSNSGNKI